MSSLLNTKFCVARQLFPLYKSILEHSLRLTSTQTQPDIFDAEEIKPPKVIEKKPQKPPFAKNLFLANFDTDILAYPEALDKEQLADLHRSLEPIIKYIKDTDLSKINSFKKIPLEIHDDLKRFKLYGLNVPQSYGGSQLLDTETCLYSEALARHNSLGLSFNHHLFLCVQAIEKYGTDKQKQQYLPRLASGQSFGAFCLLEQQSPDPSVLNTIGTISSDGKTWTLNGEKSWIVNGSQADVLLVIAQTPQQGYKFNPVFNKTAFIVERSFGGISSTPCNPFGVKGADICNIEFNDVLVPAENVLGNTGEAVQEVTPLLTRQRLNTSASCITLIHSLIKMFSRHIVKIKSSDKYLYETEAVKQKMGQITSRLYAVESMVYLTAGLLDEYEDQDCELEAAIGKVFASESCLECIQLCAELIGPEGYMEDHWLTNLRRDALSHISVLETNETVKIIIALLGLQHAGKTISERVRKVRNPLFHPGFIFKRIFSTMRQQEDYPKLAMKLHEFVHPTARPMAEILEYSVYRLQYAVDVALVNHGKDIMEKHCDLLRLTNIVADIYAMTATIGRASRAYCIGLRNADVEMRLANTFAYEALKRVKTNVGEIEIGFYQNNDVNYFKLSETVFTNQDYPIEHPLMKNF